MKDITMNIIEQLQQNEKPFGLMSEEMQAKAKEIGYHEFECHLVQAGVKWTRVTSGVGAFEDIRTYRLRADYTEPVEEYELCKIVQEGEVGVFSFKLSPKHNLQRLIVASGFADFAGYLYEDGQMKGLPVRYFHEGQEFEVVNFEALQSGDVTITHATHVVFKK